MSATTVESGSPAQKYEVFDIDLPDHSEESLLSELGAGGGPTSKVRLWVKVLGALLIPSTVVCCLVYFLFTEQSHSPTPIHLSDSDLPPLSNHSCAAPHPDSPAYTPGQSFTVSQTYGGYELTHTIGVPADYDPAVPAPVVVFFHGWTGDHTKCTAFCEAARAQGFITLSLSGMGPKGFGSWNGFGSTSAGGPDGPVCRAGGADYCAHYPECPCGAAAQRCTWTTCGDSVGQAAAMLDRLEAMFCVDRRRLWASGCSNGGMFLYELARDTRTAGRFAGIAPTVGSPHNGFNLPPRQPPLALIGLWGRRDRTVPPLSNTHDPTKSVSEDGWYYNTARNVTDLWAAANGCTLPWADLPDEYGADASQIECRVRGGCRAGAAVVECLFDGGHSCQQPFATRLVLQFMRRHPKQGPLPPNPAPIGPAANTTTATAG